MTAFLPRLQFWISKEALHLNEIHINCNKLIFLRQNANLNPPRSALAPFLPEVQEACADKQRHGEPAERAKGREIKAQPHVGHNLEKQKGIADPDGVAQGQLVGVSQTRQQAAASQTEAAIKNPQQVGARQECSCVIALLALCVPFIFLMTQLCR